MWRWDAFLPAAAGDAVSLGEGDTPLLEAPNLGLGDVWIKDESRNPTWSFKDRLASGALSMAKRFGAKVIASSSSGNAGAAAAAYAAKAGLPCIVFTFVGSAGPLVLQMRAYGAMVVKVNDKADRWRLQSLGVREFGWYPTSPFFGPVVGSNPYGMEGYKTIAYEIAEAFDWNPPDWCVLPVCYGDALFGMWKGFEDLLALGWIDRVPRFVAAEVSGSLTAAMASGDAMPPEVPRNAPSIATSIGAAQATVQGLDVLRRSRGAAVTIGDDDLRRWVVTLAAKEGIWPEASSVAPFAAIERLRADGTIAPHERCVALLTASGLEGSRSDRDGAARAAAGQWRPDRAFGRAQERLRLCPWLSSASPWTAARRSPTSRPRPRRRRRAAPRPCGSPATFISAIPSPWRRWRWAPPGASRSR